MGQPGDQFGQHKTLIRHFSQLHCSIARLLVGDGVAQVQFHGSVLGGWMEGAGAPWRQA